MKNHTSVTNLARRRITVAGMVAVATGQSWQTPIVRTVVLPAHASGSDSTRSNTVARPTTTAITPTPTPTAIAPTPTPTPTTTAIPQVPTTTAAVAVPARSAPAASGASPPVSARTMPTQLDWFRDQSGNADLTQEQLQAMTALDLRNKALTELPPDIFAGLNRVTWVSLAANNLTTLPDLSGLTALETLHLNDNQLTSLPQHTFNGLSQLKTLWLYGNGLTTVHATVFNDLTALEVLSLGGNSLAGLAENVFTGLTALERLLLDNAQLTALPDLSGLTALKSLSLDNNQLGSLPADGNSFSGLSNLRVVYLHNNLLSHLPDDVFRGLFLHELSLWGNDLMTTEANLRVWGVGLDEDGNFDRARLPRYITVEAAPAMAPVTISWHPASHSLTSSLTIGVEAEVTLTTDITLTVQGISAHRVRTKASSSDIDPDTRLLTQLQHLGTSGDTATFRLASVSYTPSRTEGSIGVDLMDTETNARLVNSNGDADRLTLTFANAMPTVKWSSTAGSVSTGLTAGVEHTYTHAVTVTVRGVANPEVRVVEVSVVEVSGDDDQVTAIAPMPDFTVDGITLILAPLRFTPTLASGHIVYGVFDRDAAATTPMPLSDNDTTDDTFTLSFSDAKPSVRWQVEGSDTPIYTITSGAYRSIYTSIAIDGVSVTMWGVDAKAHPTIGLRNAGKGGLNDIVAWDPDRTHTLVSGMTVQLKEVTIQPLDDEGYFHLTVVHNTYTQVMNSTRNSGAEDPDAAGVEAGDTLRINIPASAIAPTAVWGGNGGVEITEGLTIGVPETHTFMGNSMNPTATVTVWGYGSNSSALRVRIKEISGATAPDGDLSITEPVVTVTSEDLRDFTRTSTTLAVNAITFTPTAASGKITLEILGTYGVPPTEQAIYAADPAPFVPVDRDFTLTFSNAEPLVSWPPGQTITSGLVVGVEETRDNLDIRVTVRGVTNPTIVVTEADGVDVSQIEFAPDEEDTEVLILNTLKFTPRAINGHIVLGVNNAANQLVADDHNTADNTFKFTLSIPSVSWNPPNNVISDDLSINTRTVRNITDLSLTIENVEDPVIGVVGTPTGVIVHNYRARPSLADFNTLEVDFTPVPVVAEAEAEVVFAIFAGEGGAQVSDHDSDNDQFTLALSMAVKLEDASATWSSTEAVIPQSFGLLIGGRQRIELMGDRLGLNIRLTVQGVAKPALRVSATTPPTNAVLHAFEAPFSSEHDGLVLSVIDFTPTAATGSIVFEAIDTETEARITDTLFTLSFTAVPLIMWSRDRHRVITGLVDKVEKELSFTDLSVQVRGVANPAVKVITAQSEGVSVDSSKPLPHGSDSGIENGILTITLPSLLFTPTAASGHLVLGIHDGPTLVAGSNTFRLEFAIPSVEWSSTEKIIDSALRIAIGRDIEVGTITVEVGPVKNPRIGVVSTTNAIVREPLDATTPEPNSMEQVTTLQLPDSVFLTPLAATGKVVYGVFDGETGEQVTDITSTNDTFTLEYTNGVPVILWRINEENSNQADLTSGLVAGIEADHPFISAVEVRVGGATNPTIGVVKVDVDDDNPVAIVPATQPVTAGSPVSNFVGSVLSWSAARFTPIQASGRIVFGIFGDTQDDDTQTQVSNAESNDNPDTFTLNFSGAEPMVQWRVEGSDTPIYTITSGARQSTRTAIKIDGVSVTMWGLDAADNPTIGSYRVAAGGLNNLIHWKPSGTLVSGITVELKEVTITPLEDSGYFFLGVTYYDGGYLQVMNSVRTPNAEDADAAGVIAGDTLRINVPASAIAPIADWGGTSKVEITEGLTISVSVTYTLTATVDVFGPDLSDEDNNYIRVRIKEISGATAPDGDLSITDPETTKNLHNYTFSTITTVAVNAITFTPTAASGQIVLEVYNSQTSQGIVALNRNPDQEPGKPIVEPSVRDFTLIFSNVAPLVDWSRDQHELTDVTFYVSRTFSSDVSVTVRGVKNPEIRIVKMPGILWVDALNSTVDGDVITLGDVTLVPIPAETTRSIVFGVFDADSESEMPVTTHTFTLSLPNVAPVVVWSTNSPQQIPDDHTLFNGIKDQYQFPGGEKSIKVTVYGTASNPRIGVKQSEGAMIADADIEFSLEARELSPTQVTFTPTATSGRIEFAVYGMVDGREQEIFPIAINTEGLLVIGTFTPLILTFDNAIPSVRWEMPRQELRTGLTVNEIKQLTDHGIRVSVFGVADPQVRVVSDATMNADNINISTPHLRSDSDDSGPNMVLNTLSFTPTAVSGQVVLAVYNADNDEMITDSNTTDDTFTLKFVIPSISWNPATSPLPDDLKHNTRTTRTITGLSLTLERVVNPTINLVDTSEGIILHSLRAPPSVDNLQQIEIDFTPVAASGRIVLGIFTDGLQITDSAGDDTLTLEFSATEQTAPSVSWSSAGVTLTSDMTVNTRRPITFLDEAAIGTNITATVEGVARPEIRAVMPPTNAVLHDYTATVGEAGPELSFVDFTPVAITGHIVFEVVDTDTEARITDALFTLSFTAAAIISWNRNPARRRIITDLAVGERRELTFAGLSVQVRGVLNPQVAAITQEGATFNGDDQERTDDSANGMFTITLSTLRFTPRAISGHIILGIHDGTTPVPGGATFTLEFAIPSVKWNPTTEAIKSVLRIDVGEHIEVGTITVEVGQVKNPRIGVVSATDATALAPLQYRVPATTPEPNSMGTPEPNSMGSVTTLRFGTDEIGVPARVLFTPLAAKGNIVYGVFDADTDEQVTDRDGNDTFTLSYTKGVSHILWRINRQDRNQADLTSGLAIETEADYTLPSAVEVWVGGATSPTIGVVNVDVDDDNNPVAIVPATQPVTSRWGSNFVGLVLIWSAARFTPTQASGRIVFGIFDDGTQVSNDALNEASDDASDDRPDTFTLSFSMAAPAVDWSRSRLERPITTGLTFHVPKTLSLTGISVTVKGVANPYIGIVGTPAGTTATAPEVTSAENELRLDRVSFTPDSISGSIVYGVFDATDTQITTHTFTLEFSNVAPAAIWTVPEQTLPSPLYVGTERSYQLQDSRVKIFGEVSDVRVVVNRAMGATVLVDGIEFRPGASDDGFVYFNFNAIRLTPDAGSGSIEFQLLGTVHGREQEIIPIDAGRTGTITPLILRFADAIEVEWSSPRQEFTEGVRAFTSRTYPLSNISVTVRGNQLTMGLELTLGVINEMNTNTEPELDYEGGEVTDASTIITLNSVTFSASITRSTNSSSFMVAVFDGNTQLGDNAFTLAYFNIEPVAVWEETSVSRTSGLSLNARTTHVFSDNDGKVTVYGGVANVEIRTKASDKVMVPDDGVRFDVGEATDDFVPYFIRAVDFTPTEASGNIEFMVFGTVNDVEQEIFPADLRIEQSQPPVLITAQPRPLTLSFENAYTLVPITQISADSRPGVSIQWANPTPWTSPSVTIPNPRTGTNATFESNQISVTVTDVTRWSIKVVRYLGVAELKNETDIPSIGTSYNLAKPNARQLTSISYNLTTPKGYYVLGIVDTETNTQIVDAATDDEGNATRDDELWIEWSGAFPADPTG